MSEDQDYTYIVHLYGAQAVQDARTIRRNVVNELAGAERQFASATASTHEMITRQTRRLTHNVQRLEETKQALRDVATGWLATIKAVSGGSEGVFDSLVDEARAMYDELVGHSIFSELYNGIMEIYLKIRTASGDVFDELPAAAAQASAETIQQIEGVVNKAGRLTWPPGVRLGGVGMGGKGATQEQIDQYNQGLLSASDIMPGVAIQAGSTADNIRLVGDSASQSSPFLQEFTTSLNQATLQYFGVRRLGYGFEQLGSQVAASGERQMQVMLEWVRTYKTYNEVATRAAAAMEMTADEQQILEETVLDNIEAMKLFSPEEVLEGLRIWAAGTGAVVHSQEELNQIMEQARAVQILAALSSENLGETMTYVGGGIAEFGLTLDDVNRVAAVYNFVAAKTFAETSDVGNAFTLVGPLAHSYGITIEESAAALGLLSDENIKGTKAGRAFRQMLLQMAKPTEAHSRELNKALGLTGELGDSWQDLVFPEGEFIGFANYIDLLAAATENLTGEQKKSLFATMATANEIPALISLVDAQTEARKDGINVIRAWVKWMNGAVDEEVMALQSMLQRTRGIEMDVTTNMYSLWDQQSTAFMDSEAAKLNQFEMRWQAMRIRLGRLVAFEAAPSFEVLMDALEKLVSFVGEHPWLVQTAVIGAAAQLIIGNLLKVAGMTLGAVANILILRGAFAGFGGAVGAFQTAVTQFAIAAGTRSATSSTTAVAPTLLGQFGLALKAMLPTLAIPAVVGSLIGGYREQIDSLKGLGVEQLRALQTAEAITQQQEKFGYHIEIGSDALLRVVDEAGNVLRIASRLEALQAMQAAGVLQPEQLEELERLLSEVGPIGVEVGFDEDFLANLPEEVRAAIEQEMQQWDIGGGVMMNFTEEQIQAVEMYDEMWENLAEMTKEHTEEISRRTADFWANEARERARFLDRYSDAIRDYQEREARYVADHLKRLEKLRSDANKRILDETRSYEEKLKQIREEAAESIAEEQKDLNDRIAEETEDFKLRMERLEEDHRDKLIDLAIRRDAYGIYMEMREYKKSSRREREDFDKRIRRLKESGRERIEEIKKQNAKEEQELRKSHERRLQEIRENLEEQLKAEKEKFEEAARRREEDHERQLRELKETYDEQMRMRQDAFDQEIEDLKEKHQEAYDEYRRASTEQLMELLGYYDEGLSDYEQYLQNRLDALERYLQAEQQLWEGYDPAPDIPSEPPNLPPGVYVESNPDLFAQTVPSRELVVRGELAADINFTGDVPEGAEQLVALKLNELFDTVIDQVGVQYG